MLAINVFCVFVLGTVIFQLVHLTGISQFIKTENTTISQCISDIVRGPLPCRGHLSIVKQEMNIETSELIKEIQKVQCHQILVRTFKSNDWYMISENYIIIVENVFELEEGIERLQYDTFWNPRANIIIQINYTIPKYLPIIFNLLIKAHIFKVLVIINEVNGENVYTYHPLTDNLCRRNDEEIKHLGRCVPGAIKTKVFEQRKFVINNCTIYQAYNDNEKPLNYISEIEKYLSSIITEKENITIVYKPRREALNYIYENRTANGAFQVLLTRKADIASGGLVLLSSRAKIFDIVWGYFFEQFSVYTPAKQIMTSDKFFRGFSNLTWFLIAVSIISVLTFCNILYYKSNKPNHLNLKLYGYVLGQANKRLGDEGILRHFLIWWIFFTFCICSFYNTALYSLLTSYVQRKTTVDLKDLDDLEWKPCVPPVIHLFFRHHWNILLNSNLNSSDCRVISSALDRAAFRRDVYSIYFAYGYRFEMKNKFDEYDNTLLEPHDTVFSTTSLYFNRGSPFVRIFQKYARWMYEFGLSSYKAEELLGFNNYKIKAHRGIYRPLSLLDMRLAFYILIIGVIASIVYFGHERNNP